MLGPKRDILAVQFSKKEAAMIRKKIIDPYRVRSIKGGFSFIPHRFVTDGFLTSLNADEILLYLFLVAVSDRHGLSFYGNDTICLLLHMTKDHYRNAREGLIRKGLIAFNGYIFQVLELPPFPCEDASLDPKIRALCKNLFAEV